MTRAPGPQGVRFLDHTADVGMDIEAPSLELLFHRAAAGMLALVHGAEEEDLPAAASPGSGPEAPGPGGVHGQTGSAAPQLLAVELEAETPAELLAGWLREVLFLHDGDHADYTGAVFDRLEETVLEARVATEPASTAVREIKGVTYHELAVERMGTGWRARVIFDV